MTANEIKNAIIPFKAEEPQMLVRPTAVGEAYPVDALGPLEQVVTSVQKMTQAPVAIAAQSALAVTALCVQGWADVETLRGSVPCSLFCLTIAESGERKSSCDRLLMQGVADFENWLMQSYKKEIGDFKLNQEIWNGQRKRLLAAAIGEDPVTAAAAKKTLLALGDEPQPPVLPIVTVQEPTLEGLYKAFQFGRLSLGLLSDEAGGLIGGHAMNKDNKLKTISGLSVYWDGTGVKRVRAGDEPSWVCGRRLSIHLMAQPVVLGPLLGDAEVSGQGFLARCLIAAPASTIGTRTARGYSAQYEEEVKAFNTRVFELLALPMPTDKHQKQRCPRKLCLSEDARECLYDFYDKVERGQAAGNLYAHVHSFASKAAEQAARIAGILTLWADPNASHVTVETMRCSIRLAHFYLGEASRLSQHGQIDKQIQLAEQLRLWLQSQSKYDEVFTGYILQEGPNSVRDRKTLTPLLSILESTGWLIRLPEGTVIDGRARKEAYRIVRRGEF